MNPRRKLTFATEKLTDLRPDDLIAVHGGAPPTLRPGCQVFSDLFSCFPTAGYCPPPDTRAS